MVDASLETRPALIRQALRLEALTIGWNVLEAVIAIVAGAFAGSIALIGFGLDSVIETVAATTLYRRLTSESKGASTEEIERKEERALRIVGWTFLALAAYVAYQAGRTLWLQQAPEESGIGIALAAVSLVVMPILAIAKLRTGRSLGSRALIADAKETFVCSYLSLSLLLGLGANLLFGAWWADPVAALMMVPWVTKEGIEALRAEGCTD